MIGEKPIRALHKAGSHPFKDILQIKKDFIDLPKEPGFYLPETTILFDRAGANFASLRAHLIFWTSGAAEFNNSIVSVIRVSRNNDLLNEDIDIDATGIMDGSESINSVV